MTKLVHYLSRRTDETCTSTSPDRTPASDRTWRDTGADGEWPTLTFKATPDAPPVDTFDIFRHAPFRHPVPTPLVTGVTDYDVARYHAALFSGRFNNALVFIYYGGLYFCGDHGRRIRPLAAFRHGQQIPCPIRLAPSDPGMLRRLVTLSGEPVARHGVGDVRTAGDM